ncbi:MAG: M56 family metallopeptidase [Steroidobacteraceae bacterium]
MIGAALYLLVVSALLSVAAWLAERIAASFCWPRRGIWLAAMMLSIAVPVWRLPGALPGWSPVQLRVSGAATGAARAAPSRAHRPAVPAEAASARQARMRPASHSSPPTHRFWTPAVYERVLLGFLAGWGMLSVASIARLIMASATLRNRSRRWPVTALEGVAVTVSDDLGPAVLGILHPRIIVPRWLLEEAAERRSAVLSHESEHLRAHDGRWLLAGLLLVTLLPWNLPLRWLWRRLRLAIEVDCDARVVRRGLQPVAYGAELLAIATRTPPAPRPAIGLFERRSQLARRIRILVTPSRLWWRWAAAPLYVFTAAAALAAATFPAPPIDAALGARNQAHHFAAQRMEEKDLDARATRRLLASGQPDALAAAAVLGWPWVANERFVHGKLVLSAKARLDAARRLRWLARAVAEAPRRPDLLMLQKSFCQQWIAHCDVAALDDRLRTLDPDNGAAWLDALAAAAKAKDPAGINAALTAIGRTTRVDTYGNPLVARLGESLHQVGGMSFKEISSEIYRIRGYGLPLDAMIALTAACNWNTQQLTAPRLNLCRNASTAFEHGDTFLASVSGSEIAMRLWPAGTAEHRYAAALHRRLVYMQEQAQWLILPPGHRLQSLLALFDGQFWAQGVRLAARYPSEQDVLRAQLMRVGLRASPPPSWRDSSP